MVDLATIQAAFKTWAEAATGLNAYWLGEARGMETRSYVILDPGDITELGVDWVTTATAADPLLLVPTVNGNRTGSILFKVCSRDQTPAGTGRQYCELARSRLKQPALVAGLRAAGIALTRSGKTRSYDASKSPDDRALSIAAFEIGFSCVSLDVAPDGSEIGTIGSVGITSRLDDVADQTFTVTEPEE